MPGYVTAGMFVAFISVPAGAISSVIYSSVTTTFIKTGKFDNNFPQNKYPIYSLGIGACCGIGMVVAAKLLGHPENNLSLFLGGVCGICLGFSIMYLLTYPVVWLTNNWHLL